jgi:hypothetical protein
LYAVFDGEKVLKKASKGCKLKANKLSKFVTVPVFSIRNDVPTFSFARRNRTSVETDFGPWATFVKRSIKMTGGKMSAKAMTPWELRGYLTYPRLDGKPIPGTREEMNFSIGWARAQREDQLTHQSQLALDLDFESGYGRDTYAVDYVPEREQNNFTF